ncbi:hypothetical protein [Salinimicrobium sp. WS361]|uniref:hypothetical protein n=1 Tax=Salinimicrobium sp. WS361 TaxID=3425123 RepID=UPI003D6F63D4
MRNFFFLTILVYSLNCFSQSTLRLVDSETEKPLDELYTYIYKNGNTFANCGATNKNGFKKLSVRNFDSLSTYQISINYLQYEPVWQNIDLTKNDTLTIHVKKNPYYIHSSNDIISQGCSQYSFMNYYPREPRSLADLPEHIADKVSLYLKNRVGLQNYTNFNLIGGQIIEIDEYKRRNPKSNPKTAFYLCFAYRNLDSGIAMYSSKIELDKNGNIIKDIEFPKTTDKVKLISLSEIKKKALKDGYFKRDKTKIAMEYFSKENVLVWKFINETYKKDYTFLREDIYYNAQNANFIRVDQNKGEWIE